MVDRTGSVVGIVSRTDVVRAFLRPDDRIRADVEAEFSHRRTSWATLDPIRVDVRDGVVTLTGTLERKSTADLALRTADRTDGVVTVENRMTYEMDDTVPVYPTL